MSAPSLLTVDVIPETIVECKLHNMEASLEAALPNTSCLQKSGPEAAKMARTERGTQYKTFNTPPDALGAQARQWAMDPHLNCRHVDSEAVSVNMK